MAGDIKVPIPSLPEAGKVLKTDQIILQGSTKTQRCALRKLLTDLRVANPDMNPDDVLGMISPNNAGAHNSIYRGKNLGTRVTEAQWAEIKAGTFQDLFIGDYWTISDVIWRIAAFDYYYNTGDAPCTVHHVVVLPDVNMYAHVMNDTNTTEGGYVGSKMYKEGLTQAKNSINAAFGESHILKHRQYLCNAVTNGKPSGSDWYDSTVDLMNENMVYGGRQFSPMPDGSDPSRTCRNYTIDKSQLSLFRYEPWMICSSQFYWLRDEVSPARFASITSDGIASCANAGDEAGVRPIVGICG